jgi:hypothetical protein
MFHRRLINRFCVRANNLYFISSLMSVPRIVEYFRKISGGGFVEEAYIDLRLHVKRFSPMP